jgi:uncharacterized membrane protein
LPALKRSISSLNNLFVLRLAFLFTGQFALYEGFQDWNRGSADTNPIVAVLVLAVYGSAIMILALSLMQEDLVLRFRHFPLVPFILATLTGVYVVAEISYQASYRTDVLAFSQYAAMLFANQGLNPYLQDMSKSLAIFGVQPSDLTPLTSGAYATTMTFQYPSLQFLVFVPFVLLGLRDMRWVLIAFELGVLFTLYLRSPEPIRPLIILPMFAGTDLMINFTASSVTDMLWVLPLLFAAFNLKKPLALGLYYGLACCFKQIPWLLAPFLLIYYLRAKGYKTLNERLVAIGKVFLVTAAIFIGSNLPFMINAAGIWFRNVLTPISGELVVLSQGPSNLAVVGILPVGGMFFTLLAVGVLLVLIVNFYVYFDKLRYIFWIFPGIILWFSYRSLTNYVIYWLPLMLVSLILWYRDELGGARPV